MGALFTLWAGDKLGRKKMIFYGAIIVRSVLFATLSAG